jgi:long-chain acyl-CoA synthetase
MADQEDPITFYQRATRHPERLAVVDPDGSTVTYAELGARVDRASHALRAAGCDHGSRVAYVGGSSAAFLETLLACVQIGVHFMPINVHLAVDEVRHIVADGAVTLLVAEADRLDLAATATDAAGLGAHRRIARPAGPGWIAWADFVGDAPARPPAQRSYGQPMLYTAGTTGRPRGVKWHAIPPTVTPELAQSAAQERFRRRGMTVDGVSIVAGPLYHGAPLSLATQALHDGHTLVLMGAFDAERWLRLVSEHRVTHAQLTPIHFYRLDQLPAHQRRRYDVSSLRSVTHGGAPCPVPLKMRMIGWFGPILQEFYSASEGFGTSISSTEWLSHQGSVGHINSDGADIRIRDEEGNEMPAGEVGQIWISHRRRIGPPREGGGYMTYGDLGYVDADGWLYLVDRRTDLIVSGGVNIYPSEVEQRLGEHPEVAEVAVVGVPDEEWGQRVVAVVVPRQRPGAGTEPDAGTEPGVVLSAALRSWCRAGLAGFKCPRQYEFRAALPHSVAGKLLRRQLRQELGAEGPQPASAGERMARDRGPS